MKPTLALMSFLSLASATVLFDFSTTNDLVLEHDTDGTNSPNPIPSTGSASLNTGTFSWGNLTSDTTPNTATFNSGSFEAYDWGGSGTFESSVIDVSGLSFVKISAIGSTNHNAASEYFQFFYQLDNDALVTLAEGAALDVETHVDGSINQLDVSNATSLVVGFTFSHNGGTNNAKVQTLSVSSIPEPQSLALLSIAGVVMTGRRSRR